MNDFHLTANQLERYLQKPANQFTIEDIINYVFEKEIEIINFRYISIDEKLKTLNFVVTGKEELENLLKFGERVNGNEVLPYNNNEHPDLYIIPNFNTAFLNPFTTISTLDILCSFYTWEGQELQSTPENILLKAIEVFQLESGYDVKLFGELEYYVVSDVDMRYTADEGNYQSSEPFSKFENIRVEAMKIIAQCGGKVRFGHAEYGSFSSDERYYEQHEIEFLPTDPSFAVRQLIVAKWILRMLGKKHGVDISFAPKIALDKPGNGLHVHLVLEKDGVNILGEGREFRESALQVISGLLKNAASLTAFGNTIPVSYLRLAETQKAPKYICWGPSNRSALIRIPKINMKAHNELSSSNNKKEYVPEFIYNQSIEYRGADASAYLYFFVAAMLVAGLDGLGNPSYMTDIKEKLVTESLYSSKAFEIKQRLNKIPTSCAESQKALNDNKHLFTTKFPIFPEGALDYITHKLEEYNLYWCQKLDVKSLTQDSISKMITHFMHYR